MKPMPQSDEPRTVRAARLGNNLLAYLFREELDDPTLWAPALEVAIALLPIKLADVRTRFPVRAGAATPAADGTPPPATT